MKKFILITASTTSVLVAAYIGAWFYMEHRMNRAIDQFYNATGPAIGLTFSGNRPEVYGFPFVPFVVYERGFKMQKTNVGFSKMKITGYPIPYFPLKIEFQPGFFYWEDNADTWAALHEVIIETKVPKFFPKSTSKFHLTDWQEQVGQLEITNFSMMAKDSTLKANGFIGLDKQLQPIVSLQSKVSYYDKIINFLIKSKKIKPLAGAIALSTLNALGEETNEGVKTVDINIKIEDQQLSAGPLTVTAIPTIQW